MPRVVEGDWQAGVNRQEEASAGLAEVGTGYMNKAIIAFLWISTGTWIKWITVFFLSIFDGVWLFVIWYWIFRDRGFATDERWIDRDETPFKFWLGVAVTMTFVLGAIAFTVLVATRHFLPNPPSIPDDGPSILP